MFVELIERLAGLDARLGVLEATLDSVSSVQGIEQARVTEATSRIQNAIEGSETRLSRLETALERSEHLLRALAAEEALTRRRLWALRADPSYALAYEEAEPLVTISVLTRDRASLLLERSIPSILEQSYEHLEVLVIGDDATPEVLSVMRRFQDPRVRFVNLTTRVVREPRQLHWLAAGTLPRNEAYRLARGRWMLDFDDDDALFPSAVEDLLTHARSEQGEVVYGQFNLHELDGTITTFGGFPPQFAQFSLAAGLVHSGLRFFTRELHAADLGVPGDWYRTERMLRAGVRFSFLEQPIFDYYPSRRGFPSEESP